jgi:hypothetical protein
MSSHCRLADGILHPQDLTGSALHVDRCLMDAPTHTRALGTGVMLGTAKSSASGK